MFSNYEVYDEIGNLLLSTYSLRSAKIAARNVGGYILEVRSTERVHVIDFATGTHAV